MTIYLNKKRAEKALDIRWIPDAGVFFVDFGNARFAVSPIAATVLADGLRRAVERLPGESK